MTRTYRISVAAELAGLSEACIRAWERRYGVPRPRRTAGGFRVYSEQDVALLRRLRELTAEGVAIGEAVRLAPRLRREVAHDGARVDGATPGAPLDHWRAAILAAASRLDQRAVDAVLDEALMALPAERVYEALVVPVQREVAPRGVAEEHLVSQVVRARLLGLLRGGASSAGRHVVCACFPEEQHEVGLLGAALRFGRAGFRVTFLGARTPAEHLVRVVRTLRPEVVALSCVGDPGARVVRRVLGTVKSGVPRRTRVIAGGAASVTHRALCAELGVRVVVDEHDWQAVLR